MRQTLLKELDLLPVWRPRRRAIRTGIELRVSGSCHAPCVLMTCFLNDECRALLNAMMFASGLGIDSDICLVELGPGKGEGRGLAKVFQRPPQVLFMLIDEDAALWNEVFSGFERVPRLKSHPVGHLIEHPEKKAQAWRDWLELKLVLSGESSCP
ncbi:MAG: hypothetical protein KGI54_11005 [Pseudomonadota bacterium]|nr:hypothetical protein [Pseudomonadota bacterium]